MPAAILQLPLGCHLLPRCKTSPSDLFFFRLTPASPLLSSCRQTDLRGTQRWLKRNGPSRSKITKTQSVVSAASVGLLDSRREVTWDKWRTCARMSRFIFPDPPSPVPLTLRCASAQLVLGDRKLSALIVNNSGWIYYHLPRVYNHKDQLRSSVSIFMQRLPSKRNGNFFHFPIWILLCHHS